MDYGYGGGYGSGYGYERDFGSQLGAFLPSLIQLAVVFAALFVVWRLLMWGRNRTRGLQREPLMPSGDPMRYALASAVLKGSLFRRRIIQMAQNPFLASAPELGLNAPLLVNACKKLEFADRLWQWAFFGLLVGPMFLHWLMVDVFDIYDLEELLSLSIGVGWVAMIALAVYRRWSARFQDVRPFRQDTYSSQDALDRFGEATGVEAGFDPHRSNVVVFGQTDPFVGFGGRINAWQVAVDLTRPAQGGAAPSAVTPDQVLAAVHSAVQKLNIPGLATREIAFVNGTESLRLPAVQADAFDSPGHQAPDGVIQAWKQESDGPARVYTWFRLPTSGTEVTQNYMFRCVQRGQSLCLEAYQSVVAPVARTYREVDSIRRLGFFGLIGWTISAIVLSPITVVNGIVGVSGQLQEFISNLFGGPIARERREIRLNPMYNYGARETVREMMMADKYHIYFQAADNRQMSQAIDMQVLNATADLLQAAGIDTSSLKDQTSVIVQNNVAQTNVNIASGGGAVNIGGNANVGGMVGRSLMGGKR